MQRSNSDPFSEAVEKIVAKEAERAKRSTRITPVVKDEVPPEADGFQIDSQAISEWLQDDGCEVDDDSDVDPEAVKILEHEQAIMADTIADDVLFVMGTGMGLERLFLNHLVLYSDRKMLVFVINTTPQDDAYFLAQMKDCPSVDCPPKLINSDVSMSDRQALYMQGGVQFITSRILMVDLLTDRLPVKHVAGILVYRANQVLNSFQESFIIRLYREKKKGGIVKAFTDSPTTISQLGQLQRLIDRLYVRRVVCVPRFDVDYVKTMEKSAPDCVELVTDLPSGLRKVHSILIDLLKVCIRELKQASTRVKVQDEEDDSFNAVAYYVTELERNLAYRRTFLSDRQQRLLADIELLRQLLRMAEDMDVCTLLYRLNSLKSDKEALENSSGWMQTPTAVQLYEHIQALAALGSNKPEFVAPGKWSTVKTVMTEVKEFEVNCEHLPTQGPSVMLFVPDEAVQRQIIDLLRRGERRMKSDQKRHLRPIHVDCPLEPMWEPELVIPFIRNEVGGTLATRKEVVSDVQSKQKASARVAKKRRKFAEALVAGIPGDNRQQTTITQFGVMEYKKKKVAETAEKSNADPGPSTSSNTVEMKEEPENKITKRLGDFEKVPVVVMTVGERYNTLRALETYNPVVIIMYKYDLLTWRQIEVFHSCNCECSRRVYSLQYNHSTEEERYLSRINKETQAFHSLFQEAQNLMISEEYDVIREEPPRLQISTLNAGGRQTTEDDVPSIIVDMREFNSELPTILYKKGYQVRAATLEVGDYVLTPGMCVERKALDDLTQSLQSGRVFKQAEQMIRHYASAFLLIESNVKFESKLVNGGPFQGELTRRCREIRSQLTCLLRQHPKLRLIWSMSPVNSAEYFSELKLGGDEPDMDKAMALKGDDAEAEAEFATRGKATRPNAVILRHLTEHLPGMTKPEVTRLMLGQKFASLSELFTSSEEKLESAIGEEHSNRLGLLLSLDFRVAQDQ